MSLITLANKFQFHLNFPIFFFNSRKQRFEHNRRMFSLGVRRKFRRFSIEFCSEISFCRYFRALANGETPPTKERNENKKNEFVLIKIHRCSINFSQRSRNANSNTKNGHRINNGHFEDFTQTGETKIFISTSLR